MTKQDKKQIEEKVMELAEIQYYMLDYQEKELIKLKKDFEDYKQYRLNIDITDTMITIVTFGLIAILYWI